MGSTSPVAGRGSVKRPVCHLDWNGREPVNCADGTDGCVASRSHLGACQMAGSSEGTEGNPLRSHLSRGLALEPCAIVLFGATGDLTHRKLAPALYHLAREGNLPSEYAIVGFARRDWSDDRFREELRKTLEEDGIADLDGSWPSFAAHIAFSGGTF